jgi:hypothetical protein
MMFFGSKKEGLGAEYRFFYVFQWGNRDKGAQSAKSALKKTEKWRIL